MNPDKLAKDQEGEEDEDYIPGEVDEEENDDNYEYDSDYASESYTDLDEGMEVTVKTVMGQEFNFMVTLDTTVLDLKMDIFVNLNRMHPDTQVGEMKKYVNYDDPDPHSDPDDRSCRVDVSWPRC